MDILLDFSKQPEPQLNEPSLKNEARKMYYGKITPFGLPQNNSTPLRLCLVPGKCERNKIERKNGRKEKGKERNIIFFHLFGYP